MKDRKELKNLYKEKKFKIGVFQIRNTVNNKIYIGGSLDLTAIWNRMQMELKLGSHRNKTLQKEWKEFGEANFSFEILSEIKQDKDKDYRRDLKDLEQLFIEDLKPFAERGYNQ